MSSAENLDMSERGDKESSKQKKNCLGHQFDPGASTKPAGLLNDVDENSVAIEASRSNGFIEGSLAEEDEDFVDALLNGGICNGASHGGDGRVLQSTHNNELNYEEENMGVQINGVNIDEGTGYNSIKTLSCAVPNGKDSCVRPKQTRQPLSWLQTNCSKDTQVVVNNDNLRSLSGQRHNGILHNVQSGLVSNVSSQQNGILDSERPANGVYCSPYMQPCSRPNTLMLPHLLSENGRHGGGGAAAANIPGMESCDDLDDEGAVCDYDKFLLSEEHNSPSENSRSEEADSEFLNYHFPNTQLDCMDTDCSQCSVTEHCQYKPLPNRIAETQNYHGGCTCQANVSGEVDFDNSDYLKLFDELDGERYSAEDEAQDRWEDTGDFIDTDLPARASGMLSSSPESSLSEDEGVEPFQMDGSQNSQENDLSRNRLSGNVQFSGQNSQMYEHIKKGGNLYFPGDASICSSQRLHVDSGHHRGVNSSESENGDDYQVDLAFNCDANEVFFEEGAAGLEAAASQRNIHPAGLTNGSGVGYCVNHSDAGHEEVPSHVHNDHVRGSSADCGSALSCPLVEQVVPSGSASCQHNAWSVAMVTDPYVNDLSSESPSNVEPSAGGYHVPVSNFQNDKSNNHQKVYIKFNVTNQERKRLVGHIKRDSSHLGSPNSPDEPDSSLDEEGQEAPTDQFEYQQVPEFFQEQMMMIAAELARTRVNAESGVSEPIYEDIEPLPESDESGNTAAAAPPADLAQKSAEPSFRKPPLRVAPRCRERRSSSGGRSGIEKVMIWNEYEAYVLQVKQIATSACGPTAVLNVLKAFDVCVDKDDVCKKIHTNLRDELGSIPKYLFSRAVAGTTAEDLLQGIEALTDSRIRGRFFHFWPARDVQLLKWLGHWMKKGAVPLATLNLQKGVKTGWTIPDAWHHQMVYGVSSKGLYLTNPLENVSEETVLEQLVSDSVLLVRRQDVVNRFRDDTYLGEIIQHPDSRWRTMNVLGQVVNVLRESNMPHPMYRAQLTSHISIPAVYKAGVTLFVQGGTTLCEELMDAPDLLLKQPPPT